MKKTLFITLTLVMLFAVLFVNLAPQDAVAQSGCTYNHPKKNFFAQEGEMLDISNDADPRPYCTPNYALFYDGVLGTNNYGLHYQRVPFVKSTPDLTPELCDGMGYAFHTGYIIAEYRPTAISSDGGSWLSAENAGFYAAWVNECAPNAKLIAPFHDYTVLTNAPVDWMTRFYTSYVNNGGNASKLYGVGLQLHKEDMTNGWSTGQAVQQLQLRLPVGMQNAKIWVETSYRKNLSTTPYDEALDWFEDILSLSPVEEVFVFDPQDGGETWGSPFFYQFYPNGSLYGMYGAEAKYGPKVLHDVGLAWRDAGQ